MSGPLQCNGEPALMSGTCPCFPAWVYPRPVRDVAPQPAYVLVVDQLYFVDTEGTNLATGAKPWPSLPPPMGTSPLACHTALLLHTRVIS